MSTFLIDAPEGYYSSVAWTTEDAIITAFEPVSLLEEGMFGMDLWRLNLSGTRFERLNLPNPDFTYCHSVRFHHPFALEDGRVAFLRECEHDRGFVSELLVSSLETSAASRLFPIDPAALKIRTYSVTLDGSKGLTSLHAGIVDDLTLVTGSGAERVFGDFIRANNPGWSPNGDAFVFFGNKEIYRTPDRGWARLPYDFWLVESACEPASPTCSVEPILLLENFFPGGRPQWSPDGRWVAFSGRNWIEEEGLLLRDMETGEIIRLASGQYRDLAWAPDGHRLVVIRDDWNIPNHRYQARSVLEVFDLSRALKSPGTSTATQTPIGTAPAQLFPSLSISGVHVQNTSPVRASGRIVAGSAIDVTFTIRNDGPGDYPVGSHPGIPLAVLWTGNNSDPRNTTLPSTTIKAGEEVIVSDRIYWPPASPFNIEARLKPLFPTQLGDDAASSVFSEDFDDLQSADIAKGEAALLFNPDSAEWTMLVQVLNVGNKQTLAGVEISVPIRGIEDAVTLDFQKKTRDLLLPGECQWVFISGGQLLAGDPIPERAVGFLLTMENPDGVEGPSPMDPDRWNNTVAEVLLPVTTTAPAAEVARQIDPGCGGLP